jgi:hypothetical protein
VPSICYICISPRCQLLWGSGTFSSHSLPLWIIRLSNSWHGTGYIYPVDGAILCNFPYCIITGYALCQVCNTCLMLIWLLCIVLSLRIVSDLQKTFLICQGAGIFPSADKVWRLYFVKYLRFPSADNSWRLYSVEIYLFFLNTLCEVRHTLGR